MRRFKRKVKSSLLRFFYRNLWVRIAAILLVVVTVPVALLGVLLINTSQKAVRNSVLNNYQQIVTRAAEEIGLFVKRPQDILTATAAMLEVVYPANWKQETVLVELVLQQPIFMRAVSVDLSGAQLASSELGRGLNWDYPKEALAGVMGGKIYTSAVKLSDNHTVFLTMAVPIKKMGKTIGALIADVNLRGIWEIVDNIHIGKTGRVFVVARDGTLIAHENKKKVLKNENFSAQKEIQSVLAGRTGSEELNNPLEGKLISAYAPVGGMGWGVVLRQKQEEAYVFSKVMKMQSWIIIILSELLAILVSILIGKALARPVKTLASKIRSFAAGEPDYAIKRRMRDDMGELIHSFNTMTKKIEQARERERLSAIGEAATWLVHELKNSLFSIKAFVQLFPTRHKDERFMDKFSRLVPEEINRMDGIFRELSDFSAHHELRLARTDVKGVMDGILEVMKDEFTKKGIDIEYNPQNGNFQIEADAEKIRQIFMNLIINSINAMPAGGILTIIISNSSAHIEVRIKDTGEGMSRDEQEKIFMPFRTTKSGGMGLGLTISSKIAQQHGGNISAESELGKGTTFIVRLPVEHGEGLRRV